MTFHEFKSWFRFLGRAKNRHGVHSPFVYTFNEDVLNHSRSLEELAQNMAYYYSIETVKGIDIKETESRIKTKSEMTFKRLIVVAVTKDSIMDWPPDICEEDVLLIKPLYKTIWTQKLWDGFCAYEKITLSIDMFHAGLLFYKKEFKVKQHFLLRSSL